MCVLFCQREACRVVSLGVDNLCCTADERTTDSSRDEDSAVVQKRRGVILSGHYHGPNELKRRVAGS